MQISALGSSHSCGGGVKRDSRVSRINSMLMRDRAMRKIKQEGSPRLLTRALKRHESPSGPTSAALIAPASDPHSAFFTSPGFAASASSWDTSVLQGPILPCVHPSLLFLELSGLISYSSAATSLTLLRKSLPIIKPLAWHYFLREFKFMICQGTSTQVWRPLRNAVWQKRK